MATPLSFGPLRPPRSDFPLHKESESKKLIDNGLQKRIQDIAANLADSRSSANSPSIGLLVSILKDSDGELTKIASNNTEVRKDLRKICKFLEEKVYPGLLNDVKEILHAASSAKIDEFDAWNRKCEEFAKKLSSCSSNPEINEALFKEIGRWLNSSLKLIRGKSKDNTPLSRKKIELIQDQLFKLYAVVQKTPKNGYTFHLRKQIQKFMPEPMPERMRTDWLLEKAFLRLPTDPVAALIGLGLPSDNPSESIARIRKIIEEKPDVGFLVLAHFINVNDGNVLRQLNLTADEIRHLGRKLGVLKNLPVGATSLAIIRASAGAEDRDLRNANLALVRYISQPMVVNAQSLTKFEIEKIIELREHLEHLPFNAESGSIYTSMEIIRGIMTIDREQGYHLLIDLINRGIGEKRDFCLAYLHLTADELRGIVERIGEIPHLPDTTDTYFEENVRISRQILLQIPADDADSRDFREQRIADYINQGIPLAGLGLPPEIFTETLKAKITYLNLDGYPFTSSEAIHSLLNQCPNMRHLAIHSDLITNLPDICAQLRTLDCSGCRNLETLPKMPSLESLDCSYSAFVALPSGLVCLQSLYCLGCHLLESLPVGMINLRILNCYECYSLTEIPAGMVNLETLLCRGCSLQQYKQALIRNLSASIARYNF